MTTSPIRSVAGPALAVLLSSAGLAAFGLVVNAESPAVSWLWPARQAADAFLDGLGLAGALHAPWVQAVVFAVLLLVGSAGAFAGARRLASARDPRAAAGVLAVGALALVPQLAIPPVWSTDVFLYHLHARVAEVHGMDPYVASGTQVPGRCVDPSAGLAAPGAGGACGPDRPCAAGLACGRDPYLELTMWGGDPAAYGPIALWMARLTYDPVDGVLDNALRLRLVESLLLLAAAWLLSLAGGPRAAALLLWSPLAFLEVGNSGHTEGLIVLGIAALAWMIAGRASLGPPWFAPEAAGAIAGLMALVKLPLLALAAPLALRFRGASRRGPDASARRPAERPDDLGRWRDATGKPGTWLGPWPAVRFVAGAIGVAVAGTALAWSSPHPFGGLLAEAGKATGSMAYVAKALLDPLAGPWLAPAVRAVAAATALAWLARRSRHVDGPAPAFELAGIAWLLAIVVAFGVFHPWHALAPLAFAASLPPDRPFVRASVALSVLAPLAAYGGWLASLRYDEVTTLAIPILTFLPLLLFVRPTCTPRTGRPRG